MVEIGDYGTHETLYRIDYDRLHREKVAKTRAEMDRLGVDALLCFSDPNIEYVTNVPTFTAIASGIGGNRCAILPRDGAPIVFSEACHAYHLDEGMPDYLRVEKGVPLPMAGIYNAHSPSGRTFLVEKFVDRMKRTVADLGLAKAPIGVDVTNRTLVSSLERAGLNVDPKGAEALEAARMTKTYEEQQLFRKLTAIVDGCFVTLAEAARPGRSEREVWKECIAYAIDKGLSADGGFICSGPQTWPKDSNREVSDRILRPGDIVVADFFNFGLFGYRSCYYRTLSLGPVSEDLQAANDRALEWMEAAHEAIEPGATTKDIVDNWPREEEQWPDRPPYIRNEDESFTTFFMNMGHGLGLSLYEPPYVWKPSSTNHPQELRPGMVIAIETLEGAADGSQGVRMEDMILVTDEGCEILSRFPKNPIYEVAL